MIKKTKDYYDILGVSKSASQEEISKSYKNLVLKNHPDKFTDEKEKSAAQVKFQAINEAYDVLKDADKRRSYDMGGQNPFGGSDPFGGGSPFGRGGNPFGDMGGFSSSGSDFFEDIMSFMNGGKRQSGRSSKSSNGKDFSYNIDISITEAFEGVKKRIQYECPVKCESCLGTGSKTKKLESCSSCKGTGTITQRQGFFMIQQTCPYCKGSGERIANPCEDCRGNGVVNGVKSLILNIKPGVYSGMKIQYSGYGEDVPKGGRSGNLLVLINVTDDRDFKVNKDKHLVSHLNVSFITAILGGKLEFENIDYEKLYVDIPKGCQNDMKLRFSHKGMPVYDKNSRTDLILKCKIVLPTKVNAEQKEMLVKLHKSFSSESESSKGFFSTLKEKLFH